MGKVIWIREDLDLMVQHLLTGKIERVVKYELVDYGNLGCAVGFYYFDDGSMVGETSFNSSFVELE